jgi:predicted SnoaL-like aldol condensation-catalyzing enzyme
MTKTTPEQNKALVLQAFDTLFNKRDYEAAARFWSDTDIQHSAHIEPGRDGLFNLIRNTFRQSKSGLPMFGDHFTA